MDRGGCSIFFPKGIVSDLKVCFTWITCRGARPSCIFGCRPFSRGREYEFGKSRNLQIALPLFALQCTIFSRLHNNNLHTSMAHRIFASSTLSFVRHDLRYPYFLHVHSMLLGPTSTGSSRTTVPPFPLTLIWPMDPAPTNSKL